MSKGFSATSIDEIIFEAGVSKNGFFYHFRDKNALAKAMLQRYLDNEEAILDRVFEKGKTSADNPLDAFLTGLTHLSRLMADLPNGHPGCLVATMAYSERLYDKSVRALNKEAVLSWRKRFTNALKEIAARHHLQDDVEIEHVADMITSVIEGGIIQSRALNEPRLLSEQILVVRSYIKLLFQPQ